MMEVSWADMMEVSRADSPQMGGLEAEVEQSQPQEAPQAESPQIDQRP